MKKSWGKPLLAVLFCCGIGATFLAGKGWQNISNITSYLREAATSSEVSLDAANIAALESLPFKNQLIELNGRIAKHLNIRGLYSDMDMYITDNGYVVSATAATSTDYETEQMIALKQALDKRGVNLLYVNQPTKYLDDGLFIEEFGINSYCNQNADLFLQRITDAGINNVDLRKNVTEEGMNITDMFYRTDHHWTTRVGLWATSKIAAALNDYCGYNIDLSIYNDSNYTFTDMPQCWLGEQGQKIAASYVGLDDFTIIRPIFDTSYTFTKEEEDGTESVFDGTFDDFIDDSYFAQTCSLYDTDSLHYSYQQINADNHNADYGKVLFIDDSYGQVTEPFLTLGISEVDTLILREMPEDTNLLDIIDQGGYDTVVIAYAEFMIGAHDNPESANYDMFTFIK